MPISPTNISKNTISPTGATKQSASTFSNLSKTTGVAATLLLQDGGAFLLQDTAYLLLQGGSGALIWAGVSKS